MTVLVVDDELSVLKVTARYLQARSHTVLMASDYDRTREILERDGEAIDVVCTDVVLDNGTTGRRIAALAHELAPRAAVVYMSGYQTVIVPGSVVVAKPFETDECRNSLVAAIEEAHERNCIELRTPRSKEDS